MRRQFIAIISILVVFGATIVAQDGGSTQRIEFPVGKTSTHVKGAVDIMNPDAYVLPLREGQRLAVKLKGKDVLVHLISPTNQIEVDDSQRFDQTAQETGDYRIVVHCLTLKSLDAGPMIGRLHRYVLTVKVR